MPLPESKSEILLLHNPRCSKSRSTLALLEERGVSFAIREYLVEPLVREELLDLQGRLERPLRDFVRTGESAFASAGLSPESDDEALMSAVIAHPILLQRPIVIAGERAAIGRPPEDVLEIL